MKPLVLPIILMFALACCITPAAHARLIIYESFNYTLGSTNVDCDGGLNGGNGLPYDNTGGSPAGSGTGLRQTWGPTVEVVPGLSYEQVYPDVSTNLDTSYNAGFEHNNGWGSGSAYNYRFMTTDPYALYRDGNNFGADGTSLWFSFLLKVEDFYYQSRLAFQNPSYQNTYVGFNGTDGNLTIACSIPGNSTAGSVPATSTTNFFVGCFNFGTAGADTLQVWVNPTLGDPLGTPQLTCSANPMTLFYYQTRTSAENNMTFDEFRMGETPQDVMPYYVVPEPAALGLLALAGLLLRGRCARAQ